MSQSTFKEREFLKGYYTKAAIREMSDAKVIALYLKFKREQPKTKKRDKR